MVIVLHETCYSDRYQFEMQSPNDVEGGVWIAFFSILVNASSDF